MGVIPSTIQVGGAQYSVTALEESCFQSCCDLTGIVLPDAITVLPSYAFESCYKLQSITLPNNLEEIAYLGLCGCRSLTSIELPASLKSIGEVAFYQCDYITKMTCLATSPPQVGEAVWPEFPEGVYRTLYVPEESVELYINDLSWKCGFDYILPITSTAIADVNVENASKAHKSIVDGQLVIEKDGVRYNVTGQAIK